MRLLVRPRDERFRGSVHALRSAYNQFTLVEPFPNGNLYFKRIVDRPTCVYVVGDRIFVLSTRISAHSLTPVGGGRFHLERDGRFFSLGDYLDDDTCVPTGAWAEGKAWEAFRLVDAPCLDQRERAIIARIDALSRHSPGETPLCDEIDAEMHALHASITAGPAKPGTSGARGRACGIEREIGWGFRGRVDVCRRTHAAGWAARHREPTVVSVFVNGVRVGEARCEGERPDVMAAGFALNSAWSFEFGTPLGAGDRVAFRFADGSPLRRAADETDAIAAAVEGTSPAPANPMPTPASDSADDFAGRVEWQDARHASGWAARGREPAVVAVHVNERLIGEARPTAERPDVAAAGFALRSGWTFAFPTALRVDDRVVFRFPDGSPLRPVGADQAEAGGPPQNPTGSPAGYIGSVDLFDASHATGWAARGLEPAMVGVYVNERKIGETHPAVERQDVAAAGYALRSGWSFHFPRPLKIGDRLAFRLPDGSLLPFATGADRGGRQTDPAGRADGGTRQVDRRAMWATAYSSPGRCARSPIAG